MKNNEQGMTIIVKTITHYTAGLILLYGLYISLRSHTGPGGGFAGGVIIALSFVHLVLAFGKNSVWESLSRANGRVLVSASGLVFLFISMWALTGRGRDSGVMFLCDVAVSVEVGVGLFVIFMALASFKNPAGEK